MGGTSSAQAVSGQEVPTLDDLIKTLPKMMRVSSDFDSMSKLSCSSENYNNSGDRMK